MRREAAKDIPALAAGNVVSIFLIGIICSAICALLCYKVNFIELHFSKNGMKRLCILCFFLNFLKVTVKFIVQFPSCSLQIASHICLE